MDTDWQITHKAMVYKVKVKKEKTAAFYQMLQSLRNMDVIESVEMLDDSFESESFLEEEIFWVKDKRKDINTLEMMKKYSDLVDLD